jgi:hypothetical protein
MLRPRLLTSSGPPSAWRTRQERRFVLNFRSNINGLFVNLSQRRFSLESGLKKIPDANTREKWSKVEKWSKMKRDAAFRNLHQKARPPDERARPQGTPRRSQIVCRADIVLSRRQRLF